MSRQILLALLLSAACAGPSAHQTRAAPQPEAVRVAVASTLGPDDPLAAPNCGLPTAPGSPCTEDSPEPEKKEAGDEQHQHHGAPSPEQHHQHEGKAAPSPAAAPAAPPATEAPEALVSDPVCKMKLDPKTAKGGTLKVDGKQYWFCSSSCRRTFVSQNPGAK